MNKFFDKLLCVFCAAVLAVSLACSFVACGNVDDPDEAVVTAADGRYFSYNAADGAYSDVEYLEISGGACTLSVKLGGITVSVVGNIFFAGDRFTVACEYDGGQIAFTGVREDDGVLLIDSKSVDGEVSDVLEYYCRKGKKPAAAPEEKYYLYDAESGTYSDFDMWTVSGSSCVWTFLDVSTGALTDYRGSALFTGNRFVMNLTGALTTADSCVITYSGEREGSGVMRVDRRVITVYSQLVEPAVTAVNEVMYYCKKGDRPAHPVLPTPPENPDDPSDPSDPTDPENPDTPTQPETTGVKISFDANGGRFYGSANPVMTIDADRDGTVFHMPEPTRDGYRLAGYNSERSGSGTAFDKDGVYTKSATYYAVWVRVYTVTFFFYNINCTPSYEDYRTVDEGAKLGGLPAPTSDDGGVFVGWFHSDGTEYTAASTVDKDLELTAKWEYPLKGHEIVFDGNGGVLFAYSETDKCTFTTDEKGNVPYIPDAYRHDYEFMGFNTKSDGSGEYLDYADDDPVFSSPQTYYAVWKYVFTIYFDFNNRHSNIVSAPNRKIYEGDALGTLPRPTSSDAKGFIGWFDADGNQYNSKSVPNRTLTLYAHWEYKSFFDEYNAGLVAAENQRDGHAYFHYKSLDHLRSEEGSPVSNSAVYKDIALWVNSTQEGAPGRLFLPTAIDFGGLVFDIDANITYTDGGWDSEAGTRGDKSICYNGQNIKAYVVRLTPDGDKPMRVLGGVVDFYQFGTGEIRNIFTDDFQMNRGGDEEHGFYSATYTPDLRFLGAPFSHF